MNLKLVEDVLFVNMNLEDEIVSVKNGVLSILNEHDIHNIVLHIMNSDFYESRKFNAFLHSFRLKNNINLIIK